MIKLTNNIKIIMTLFFVSITFTGLYKFVEAENLTINACANKTGNIYMIGDNFLFKKCRAEDKNVSWNIQGQKGENAKFGSGNIAFCNDDCREVLRTDGTTWYKDGNGQWLIEPNKPDYLPVPVSNIINWKKTVILDNKGDVWRWDNNTWNNIGHPPTN